MRPLANALAGVLPCHISFPYPRAQLNLMGVLLRGGHHEKSHCRIHRHIRAGLGRLRRRGHCRHGQRGDVDRHSRYRRRLRLAYGIGQVSGCHVNPAVSFGVLIAGRMTTADFITYVIAQVLGAIAGAAVLYLILSGKASGWSGSLGQNG